MTEEQQQQLVATLALLAAMLREAGLTAEGAEALLGMAANAVLAGVFGLGTEHPDADVIGEFAASVIAAALTAAYRPKAANQKSRQLQA